jgi:hypothetical protein
VCCLYDSGAKAPYETMKVAQFNIEWLTDGADHIE